MAEVLLSSDDLTVLGGPAEITVDVDFGPQGSRGSLILYGLGKPDDVVLPEVPQVYDTYINLLTSDSEYLFMYQYIAGVGGTPEWTRLFKIVPNTYSENLSRTFSDGEIEINIPLAAIVNPDFIGSYTAENFNVHCTVLGLNPLATSVSVSDLVVVSDLISLPITIKAIEYLDGAWSPITGLKTVHLSITVV